MRIQRLYIASTRFGAPGWVPPSIGTFQRACTACSADGGSLSSHRRSRARCYRSVKSDKRPSSHRASVAGTLISSEPRRSPHFLASGAQRKPASCRYYSLMSPRDPDVISGLQALLDALPNLKEGIYKADNSYAQAKVTFGTGTAYATISKSGYSKTLGNLTYRVEFSRHRVCLLHTRRWSGYRVYPGDGVAAFQGRGRDEIRRVVHVSRCVPLPLCPLNASLRNLYQQTPYFLNTFTMPATIIPLCSHMSQ
ncbi:hypothetical protein PYCCODRAFT_1024801 [Trametes coccinea BRFM310]|uniref:Uncharacterized protein n=1 Tax=Trametes coccinea (strain BRFM310) TaxID=1353009 RepID=A0A1Y2ICN2_TRAC3|nr:hypothetical protein PYCCODRAFT_1024801 [Trametes coccinea BRFM310]